MSEKSSSSSSEESFESFLKKLSGLDVVDIETVSGFVGYDLHSQMLYKNEINFLLMYYIIKFEKYRGVKLNRRETFFLTAALYETKQIEQKIEINFDYEEIWNKS